MYNVVVKKVHVRYLLVSFLFRLIMAIQAYAWQATVCFSRRSFLTLRL